MVARDELVAAVTDRYARGDRDERGRILDEFAAVTGYAFSQTELRKSGPFGAV
jgi:hypothetical protein